MPELPAAAYHFVDAHNWPSVQREGLLVARSLLSRNGEDESGSWRPGLTTLPDGSLLRDQAPARPEALRNCLDQGLSPGDWYALLNAHVFFWLDRDRVRRHARALRDRPQYLLILDIRMLASVHGDRCAVTPFNIGSAVRRPAARGLRTLVPLPDWRISAWAGEALPGNPPRSPRHPPAELVLLGDLPDAFAFVETVVDPADLSAFLSNL